MSIYISKVSEIALSNKYTTWYLNICSNALKRCSTRKDAKELLGYVEGHHILPKCFKIGGYNDKENIVYLSGREHIIIHWLATKMFDDSISYKLKYAFKLMMGINKNNNKRMTSLQYHSAKKLKIEQSPRCMTLELREKISKSKLGIQPSLETRDKQSKSMIGKESKRKNKIFGKQKNPAVLSDDEKQRRTNILNKHREESSLKRKGCVPHNKGIPHTEEVKAKMRKPRSEEGKANIREGIKRRDAKIRQEKLGQ